MSTIPARILTMARVAEATFPSVPVPVGRGSQPLPVVMTAIGIAQSDGEAAVGGDRLGTCEYCTPPACGVYTSWGLWQIHLGAHVAYLEHMTQSTDPCVWAQWLKTPAHNARAILAPDGQIPSQALLIARLNTAWGGKIGNWQAYVSASQMALAEAAVARVHPAAQRPATQHPATGIAGSPTAVWIGVGVGLVTLGVVGAVIDIQTRRT
jgi:hypothetical protein